jgi:trans-aconitate 2-methyltransferase
MTESEEHGHGAGRLVREWDAGAYHRLSDPQFSWGIGVLDRLTVRGDERVLDAGCGSGRLTRELMSRVPKGTIVGCDLSWNMVRSAGVALGVSQFTSGELPRRAVVCANLLALPWRDTFDVVFSTATFHWVLDHDRLFRELRRALGREGVLEAQCGGGPNLERVHARAKALATSPELREYFDGWRDPWLFASPEQTEIRLRDAGFARAHCWLEETPTSFVDERRYRSFLETVVMRPFLARLPSPQLRSRFLDELVVRAREDAPPFVLDYWRLNISASTS